MSDPCLLCELQDCDESDPRCPLRAALTKSRRDWYIKLKADPVRLSEYKRKKKEIKKKWLKTAKGRELWAAQVRRYRKKKPQAVLDAGRRYHERNKEERLLQARLYKRRVRKEKRQQGGWK